MQAYRAHLNVDSWEGISRKLGRFDPPPDYYLHILSWISGVSILDVYHL